MMGRVKQLASDLQEKELEQLELDLRFDSENTDPRYRGLENTDEARQQYEKEFNDWLDFFETKYGLRD